MPAKVACPGCGQQFAAPDHLYGKVVGCPSCQTRIQIPLPQAKPLADPLQANPLQAADPLQSTPVQNADPLATPMSMATPTLPKSPKSPTSGGTSGVPGWVWLVVGGVGGVVLLIILSVVIVSLLFTSSSTVDPASPPTVAANSGEAAAPAISNEDRERQRRLEAENAAIGTRHSQYFLASGPAWSVPEFEPRTAVPAGKLDVIIQQRLQFQPTAEDVLAARETVIADQLATAGRNAEAEVQYASITTKYPRFARAHFQRALNLQALGTGGAAKASFDKAISNGFWDYPAIKDENRLKEIRNQPDFETQLRSTRSKYEQRMKNLRGTPVVVLPEETAQPSPCIVLLHGYADSNRTYVAPAKAWAELGFVAIALPGSMPYDEGYRFTWSDDSIEKTHQDIQQVLKQDNIAPYIQSGKINLLGFSQGGLHAFQLLMMHPNSYAGCVAISPAGKPWVIDSSPELNLSLPRKYWFVHGEQETSLTALLTRLKENIDEARWTLKISTHPGGHESPSDWATTRKAAAAFLLE
ncbi:MAG: putative esterase [Pirellulaceae bacterium]